MKVPIDRVRLSRYRPEDYEPQTSMRLRSLLMEQELDFEILVRPTEDLHYEVLMVPQVLLAARAAGYTRLGVQVAVPLDEEHERKTVAVGYAVPRKGTNPIQRARHVAAYYEELKGHTKRPLALAAALHDLERSSASHLMRLLTLPNDVQTLVENKSLGERQARELTRLDSARIQRILARRIIRQRLSTRQAGALIEQWRRRHVALRTSALFPQDEEYANDPGLKRHALELEELIDCPVRLAEGTLQVGYATLDDLSLLLWRLRATRREHDNR